ncbi:MAG: glucan biosynthesis protein [Planctomycetota bacterium]
MTQAANRALSPTRTAFAGVAACLAAAASAGEPRQIVQFGTPEPTQDAAADPLFLAIDRRAAVQPVSRRPKRKLGGRLADLDYDDYRRLVFRHDRNLWRDGGGDWQLGFFHPGYLFLDPIEVNEVAGDDVRPVRYDVEMFDQFGLEPPLTEDDLPATPGFAGLKLWHRFDGHETLAELGAFLGASYFRVIGDGIAYGTSIRGLAIDTGTAKPEEFPRFDRFWIERPRPDADRIRLWATLTSESVRGTYAFTITPGTSSTVAVRARLYVDRPIEKLCLGPLTSMWAWGERRGGPDEPRPRAEVHDSDGLLIHATTGEWLWRPLRNPVSTSVAQYRFPGVRGFGLMQRDRDPASYGFDAETNNEHRPSIWIEPTGGSGPGRVELLEIAGPAEWFDNIAAYWVPDRTPRPGDVVELAYTIHVTKHDPPGHRGGRVVQTRTDHGAMNPLPIPNKDEFTEWSPVYRADQLHDVAVEVDFAGPRLAEAAAVGRLTADVSELSSTVTSPCITPLGGDRVRLSFHLFGAGPPGEVRACLRSDRDYLTETWSYLCTP